MGGKSRRSAATLPSATGELVGITPPKISDIFDAPVRLGELSKQLERTQEAKLHTHTSIPSQHARPHQVDGYHRDIETFTTLPAPIIFDGPARPAHLSPRILEKRRQLRQELPRPAIKNTLSFSSRSEILCEIFDGPSRIARYKYHTRPDEVGRLFMGISVEGPAHLATGIPAVVLLPLSWSRSLHIKRLRLAGIPRTIMVPETDLRIRIELSLWGPFT
ncbi:hypothetical protein ID866_2082 [Astraeus odoratus]|nr:hypothetical protein ID866_2082 [Astraeus odoratus]